MTTSITLSQEHLVQNMISRILERVLSREQNQDVSEIQKRFDSELPRLADANGLLISSCPRLLESLLISGLTEISNHLNYKFAVNPGVKDISNKMLVLIQIKPEDVSKDAKAVFNRLEKQAKAVEQTGAIAEVYLEGFENWSSANRAKFDAIWNKFSCPRLMLAVGIGMDVQSAPSNGVSSKCLVVEVGQESPVIR